MLLSHCHGHAFTEDILDPVDVTQPKLPEPGQLCPNPAVAVEVFDAEKYWPDYEGPTTCLLAQMYEPHKPPVEVIKLHQGLLPLGNSPGA